MLNNVVIILVETSHPGNMGAAARAMKNMGLSELRLVNPRFFPHPEASARAAGAEDILANARCFTRLEQAISDCGLVIGTSARQRALEWPALSIDQDAGKILEQAAHTKTAILFGRESSGLTNAELQCCHYQIAIKAHPAYASLNLAAAVQIIAYELFVANEMLQNTENQQVVEDAATGAELTSFYQHLEQVAVESGYLNLDKPGQLMPRFKKLYNRAGLTKTELNMLRGLLAAVQKKLS